MTEDQHQKTSRWHDLKTLPEFFSSINNFEKTFELRYDDRDYKVGDALCLKEWSEAGGYTGRELCVSVSYILKDTRWLQPGIVCMGFILV